MRPLRYKITKEIEDICGDLYPTLEELTVILRAIQFLCGPPDGEPDWNWWWSGSKLNCDSSANYSLNTAPDQCEGAAHLANSSPHVHVHVMQE